MEIMDKNFIKKLEMDIRLIVLELILKISMWKNLFGLNFRYLQKGESIEFDLSLFIGNKTIKLIHPIKFEFDNLIGNLFYMDNDSNVINQGIYQNYKFKYTASSTNGNYIDTIKYYVFKYNRRMDSEIATIKFEISNENIILDNCENKYYILKGNKKECYNSCPK